MENNKKDYKNVVKEKAIEEVKELRKQIQELKEKNYIQSQEIERLEVEKENIIYDYETRDNECDHIHNQLEAANATIKALEAEVKEARKSEQDALGKYKKVLESAVEIKVTADELSKVNDELLKTNRKLLKRLENYVEKSEPKGTVDLFIETVLSEFYNV